MVGTASLAPIWSAPLRVYPAAMASTTTTSGNTSGDHRKGSGARK